jgi:hypothetical protein
MADSFDPYYKWLAIPPSEQPPDHYRLLGIPLYTDDADVISNAADQRMAHVRSFQVGQRAEESQRILNELASARLCLLKPDAKLAYDEKLRAATPVSEPAMVAAAPAPLAAAPLPFPVLPPSVQPPLRPAGLAHSTPAGVTPAISVQPHRRANGLQPNTIIMVAVAGGVGLLLLAVAGPMLLRSGNSPEQDFARQATDDRKLIPDRASDDENSDPPAASLTTVPDEPPSEIDRPFPDSPGEAEDEPPPTSDGSEETGAADDPQAQQAQRLTDEREDALQRGDLAAAVALTGQLAAVVDGDAIQMKLEVVAARLMSLETPEQHRALATVLLSVLEEAAAIRRWPVVERYQDDLLKAAREAGDGNLVRKATLLVLKVQEMQSGPAGEEAPTP